MALLVAFLVGLAMTYVSYADDGCRVPSECIIHRQKVTKDKCYLFCKSYERSHNAALRLCISVGGTLARPKTEAINSFLANQVMEMSVASKAKYPLGNYDPPRYWIGLDDIREEGVFVWGGGQKLDYPNGFHKFDSYFEGPRKGFHLRHTEDCVALDKSGTWHDFPCGFTRLSYICEFRR